ncbi:methylthioribulose 1-phosphate dehydratase [Gluconacetobacter azotocaptans]|uniref:Methylthioribulose-1-phosphate dehydratase n=1 Tax=Gluconacetobacter azotocaptans TaxID=142834 RepID=A0A7W4PEM4_9PROT|nr:methylthioribulose 1-phosphate dehydratase [Gluconacetobacter azotocaptans]MBB2191502.1 methylthioribulose 1-phosphate dehydratase [Gluconacetobacter azotocaptans]MBM9403030.1 methylthioribulose 1-phosphate dehydratase [Gluconacetobacter azotocaptans]GBQ32808.1 methylthioribulose-1-phosphate dehydratase [Gluconacetobacter azotocaptans DSM 13594]
MDSMIFADPWTAAVGDIVSAGRRMDRFGWVPATAGNISRRLADGRIAITRSGGHKGHLTPDGVIEVGPDGRAVQPGDRPSAETLLHCQLYAFAPEIGAVLHGHSVASTVLSMAAGDAIELTGYEVLKVFEGQDTHDTTVRVPVFDNDQDIARLAGVVAPHLGRMPAGYVIRGHGVYVWGGTMDSALARLEGLEFLLACELERRKIAR